MEISIFFYTDKQRSQYSANPIVNGQMFLLPSQPTFKQAYKKAMSWCRCLKTFGTDNPKLA